MCLDLRLEFQNHYVKKIYTPIRNIVFIINHMI